MVILRENIRVVGDRIQEVRCFQFGFSAQMGNVGQQKGLSVELANLLELQP